MIYLSTSLFLADQGILNVEVIIMINIILFCSLIEINFFLLKGMNRILCFFVMF